MHESVKPDNRTRSLTVDRDKFILGQVSKNYVR